MHEPWVSVVMPLHNGAAWVEEALASVIREVGEARDVEVLIVDDGSSDDGVERIRTRAAEHSWIRLLGPTRRGSWTATTNVGLTHARGEWATVLHQDDVWLPGRLAAIRPLCTDGRVAVFAGARFLDDAGRDMGPWTPPCRDGSGSDRVFRSLLVQNWACVPAVTFHRRTALDSGGFDEALWYTPDWDLWLRLAARGPVVTFRRTVAGFRLHSGSQTVAGSADAAGFRRQLVTVLARHGATAVEPRVHRAAELSVAVNVALASGLHSSVVRAVGAVAAAGLRAGPRAAWIFVRWSRIGQRLVARLRARLRH